MIKVNRQQQMETSLLCSPAEGSCKGQAYNKWVRPFYIQWTKCMQFFTTRLFFFYSLYITSHHGFLDLELVDVMQSPNIELTFSCLLFFLQILFNFVNGNVIYCILAYTQPKVILMCANERIIGCCLYIVLDILYTGKQKLPVFLLEELYPHDQ